MEMQEWLNWIIPTGTVIAALISARASRISANAARRSNAAAFAALEVNQKIAENDWRIRMMDERMKVWRAFDDLMTHYMRGGMSDRDKIIEARNEFQRAPFLFPAEVDRYLNKLTKRMIRQIIMLESQRVRDAIDDEKTTARRLKKAGNIFAWLANQQSDGKKIFQKYMSLID